MSAKIKIRIDEDGNTHLDVAGVQGATCENLTDLLIQGLGDVEEMCPTEEYVQERPDYIHQMDGE